MSGSDSAGPARGPNPREPGGDWSAVDARMRAEWDARAREHARRYINDREYEGFDFLLSGCRDAFEVVGPLHERMRHDMHMVEIGCGIGRMLPFFAMLFEQVHGVDVAPGMVEEGRRVLAHLPNVTFHLGNGRSLTGLDDASCDLAISFQVFQHIPDKGVIRDYVADAFRVLKPGGLARFMVKQRPWAGQPAEPDTWNGVDILRADIDQWAQDNPWVVESVTDFLDPTRAWVLLRKPGS
ncbi:MAG: class I SAM-dependent methyltransferase [Planctomycetota bacterium]